MKHDKNPIGIQCKTISSNAKNHPNNTNPYIQVIMNSELFDERYYIKNYKEELQGLEPATHYLQKGWLEGKDPSLNFSTMAYLTTYPDIEICGMNPLLHYELYGRTEKRVITPLNSINETYISENYIENLAKAKKDTKIYLLISHELSQTGAPRALLNLAQTIRGIGYMPVILSLKDGTLRTEIENSSIDLVVAPFLKFKLRQECNMYSRFLSLFDTIVFNTLDTCPLIEFFPLSDSIRILWLHEGAFSYDILGKTFDIKNSFPLFDHIYAVGNYSLSFARKYIKDDARLSTLLYGIPDIKETTFNSDIKNKNEKKTFLLAGAISKRKGQDILIDAIGKLDTSLINDINILLAGPSLDEKLLKRILGCKYPCIKYLGELNHSELMTYFDRADIILCPSLDDPMPIVCTEAMIFGKTIIVSEATGTAGLIDDGVNGFIVPTNDSYALAEKIKTVYYSSKERLQEIGREARKLYDYNFTEERFRENVYAKIIAASKTVSMRECTELLTLLKRKNLHFKKNLDYQQVKNNIIKSNIGFIDSLKIIMSLCQNNHSFKNYRLFYKLIWYKLIRNKTNRNS